jgi:peptidoglycan/LPS O-acetylase OafA/YrhL
MLSVTPPLLADAPTDRPEVGLRPPRPLAFGKRARDPSEWPGAAGPSGPVATEREFLRPREAVRDRPALATGRSGAIDACRFLAAVGVTWVHAAPMISDAAADVGRIGTGFFAATVAYFVLRGQRRTPTRKYRGYAVDRLRRLYVPFLAWSAVSLLAGNVWRVAAGGQPPRWPKLTDLLLGTNVQLYFLPFALLICLACFPIGKLLARSKPIGQWLVAAFAVVAAVVISAMLAPRATVTGAGFGGAVWSLLPAAALGLALTIAEFRIAAERPRTIFFTAAGALLLAAAAASFGVVGYNHFGRCFAGAGVLAIAVAKLPVAVPGGRCLAGLGRYSFGIFLIHPLILLPIKLYASGPNSPPSIGAGAVATLVAVAGSLLLSVLLLRSPRTRWLVA